MRVDVRPCSQCRDSFKPKYASQRFCSVACVGLSRRMQAEQRFWKRVDVRGQSRCWEWKGPVTDRGYGSASYERKTWRAHRLALFLSGRDLPSDAIVMHTCDNPPCCNPAHLRLGTPAENNADMVAKGRNRHFAGSQSGNAKLTEDTVREIRASSEGLTTLAGRYGVTKSAICNVRNHKTWRHVS